MSGRSLGFLGGLWEVFQLNFLALESLKPVWEVSGGSLEVSWRSLGSLLEVFGRSLGGFWRVSKRFLEVSGRSLRGRGLQEVSEAPGFRK